MVCSFYHPQSLLWKRGGYYWNLFLANWGFFRAYIWSSDVVKIIYKNLFRIEVGGGGVKKMDSPFLNYNSPLQASLIC